MRDKILFRASKCGVLLMDNRGSTLTDKQSTELTTLQDKEKRTDKQSEKLQYLINKRDAPFEFGKTAKSYISDLWLRDNFDYDEHVVTPQLLKGLLCEQDAIELLSKLVKSNEFRIKNEKHYSDDYFTGTPDIVLSKEGIVEDVKCNWTVKQFFEAEPTKIYETQLQVYMYLTGCKKARLIYALVDTPFQLVEEEKKRYWFKFNCDDENQEYKKIEQSIDKMHKVSYIPIEKRLKIFELEYNPYIIEKLKERIIEARKYYNTLTL